MLACRSVEVASPARAASHRRRGRDRCRCGRHGRRAGARRPRRGGRGRQSPGHRGFDAPGPRRGGRGRGRRRQRREHAARHRGGRRGLVPTRGGRPLTEAGPGAIAWLATTGVAFDRGADGRVHLGLEGGHRHRRILHAGGDRTGAVLAGGLAAALAARPRVEVRTGEAVELLVDGRGAVTGVVVDDGTGAGLPAGPRPPCWPAAAWAPPSRRPPTPRRARATAWPWRCGPAPRWPTWSSSSSTPRPWPCPATRCRCSPRRCGARARCCWTADGAPLHGRRHPLGDLAPRDIVARAVHAGPDGRRGPGWTCGRWPPRRWRPASRGWWRPAARRAGPRGGPLPVTPAAPLHHGRVATDDRGRRRCGVCGPSGRSPAPACTAPTGWPATRCWKPWWWAAGPGRPSPASCTRPAAPRRWRVPRPRRPACARRRRRRAWWPTCAPCSPTGSAPVRDPGGLARRRQPPGPPPRRPPRRARGGMPSPWPRPWWPAPRPGPQPRGPLHRPVRDRGGSMSDRRCRCPCSRCRTSCGPPWREDLGRAGDLTTDSDRGGRAAPPAPCWPPAARAWWRGLDLAAAAFAALDPDVVVQRPRGRRGHGRGGRHAGRGDGPRRALLSAERTALNFVGHLSGVATAPGGWWTWWPGPRPRRRHPQDDAGPAGAEKYAVRCGGGGNHRFGLDDAVLVKDNHIRWPAGSPRPCGGCGPRWATRSPSRWRSRTSPWSSEALDCGVRRAPARQHGAGAARRRRPPGRRAGRHRGLGHHRREPPSRRWPPAGVDLISVGWITHSAPSSTSAWTWWSGRAELQAGFPLPAARVGPRLWLSARAAPRCCRRGWRRPRWPSPCAGGRRPRRRCRR